MFNDPTYDNIETVLYKAKTEHNATAGTLLSFVLENEPTIEEDAAIAKYIRTSFAIGWPLDGFDHDADDEDGQLDKTQELMSHFLSDLEKDFQQGLTDDVNFFFYNRAIFSEFLFQQVIRDLVWLGGSLLFIFFVMLFHTRSLFITCFAIISIFFSFFTANLIYRFVLDYRHIGLMHVLALFIILGIGADDVFVFYDLWRESHHYPFPSLAHRMWFVYKRACFAMLWTSLTTAIAFIVSASSPFLAVNTFGVFAGLLVFVNYMSIIIYFPTVVLIYHIYFERFKCCCCCATGPVRDATDEETAVSEREEKGVIVRFFGGIYFDVITHKIARWFILLGFAALLATFIAFAAQLEVQQEQVRFKNAFCKLKFNL